MEKNSTTYGLSAFIGESIVGAPFPVFFDPHFPISKNRPPVTLITGGPGSGKSFFGMTLAAQASVMNKVNLVIDPKGDFTILRKLYSSKSINKVQIWSILNEEMEVAEENVGMLDPTSFSSELTLNAILTLEVIKIIVGELDKEQENAIIPIIKDVVESESPSLLRVIQKLLGSRSEPIRAVGTNLELCLNLKISKILTVNKRIKKKKLNLKDGTIIINLLGISLPKTMKDDNSYSTLEKISICIIRLISLIALNLMRELPVTIHKTLIIDEAWTLMATPAGSDMIAQIALLGRSRNVATILLSQSPRHFEMADSKADMESTISTRFAFGNSSQTDNKITVTSMRLPEDEQWEILIPELEQGCCLMQDCMGEKSFIQVYTQDEWAASFDTNPNKKILQLNSEEK